MNYFSQNSLLETIIPAHDANEVEKDGLGKQKETAESVHLGELMRQSVLLPPSKTEVKSEGGGEMNRILPAMVPANHWSQGGGETNSIRLPEMVPANHWSQGTLDSTSKVDVQEDFKDKEHPTDWISDICDNEILAADPFKLLVVLLIVSICTDSCSL
jgi:hypothetical protein